MNTLNISAKHRDPTSRAPRRGVGRVTYAIIGAALAVTAFIALAPKLLEERRIAAKAREGSGVAS